MIQGCSNQTLWKFERINLRTIWRQEERKKGLTKSTAVTRLILDDNTDQTGEHVRHEDVESGVGDLSSDDSAREGEDNLHGSLGETHKDGLERGVSVWLKLYSMIRINMERGTERDAHNQMKEIANTPVR